MQSTLEGRKAEESSKPQKLSPELGLKHESGQWGTTWHRHPHVYTYMHTQVLTYAHIYIGNVYSKDRSATPCPLGHKALLSSSLVLQVDTGQEVGPWLPFRGAHLIVFLELLGGRIGVIQPEPHKDPDSLLCFWL